MEDLMDHLVKLDKLPDGFEFPPELKDRIFFDADHSVLVCRGYMSKTEFDRLCQHTKDWKFRRTLEELFCESVPEMTPQERGMRGLWEALRRRFIIG
jgi:hypothetical protein